MLALLAVLMNALLFNVAQRGQLMRERPERMSGPGWGVGGEAGYYERLRSATIEQNRKSLFVIARGHKKQNCHSSPHWIFSSIHNTTLLHFTRHQAHHHHHHFMIMCIMCLFMAYCMFCRILCI